MSVTSPTTPTTPTTDAAGERCATGVRRPGNATGILIETTDGISIELPARGFFKGSKGLGGFSVAWFGFVGLFTLVMLLGKANSAPGGDALLWLILGVFWVAGLVMVFGAARSGRRRGLIDVVGTDLLITRQALGGPRAEHWAGGEIAEVVAAKSDVEVNGKPVLHLKVRLRDGSERGFFPERDDRELRWIASEVSAALGIEGPA